MLRITPNSDAVSAAKYHDENLVKSDYYTDHDKIMGMWGGRAAATLGLSGAVQKEHYHKLCYNINPVTDEQLTARNDADRIVGYDFTFDVPKSASLIHAITGDQDIKVALDTAIQQTMADIEQNTETRVRKGGKVDNRTTGNLVWAAFTHDDARPVDGIPDPHLHQHVLVFNATNDLAENQWKAINFRNLKTEAPYYEALFHNRLAHELQKAGYTLERGAHNFEIAGFKRETIDKFSRRKLEIDQKAKEKGITHAEDKAALGAKTRANKRTGLEKEEVKKQWVERLNENELKLIWSAKNKNRAGDVGKNGSSARDAINHALAHGLERKSVIAHNELMTDALKQSMGNASKEDLEAEIKNRKDLLSREINRKKVYTHTAVLQEEKKLIEAARAGLNQYKPVHPGYAVKNKDLNEEQRQAVKHVLESRDFITLIVGGAGTGKTWSVKEIEQAVKEKNMGFHAFAPSSAASRGVQREEGFQEATTVAAFMQDKKLQENIKGGMVWIDEAGLIGCQTLNGLVAVAKEQNARLLLTGDTRQHTAVERGDALRILQKFGGIKPAYINKIQRQKKDAYLDAVKSLSEGNIKAGFEKLDTMGAIKECGSFENTVNALAHEYVQARKSRENVLAVAATHKQGKALTGAIREYLKKENKLGKQDRAFDIQTNLSLTEAQKKDKASYQKGQSIQFHQNVKGFTRGAKYDVSGTDEAGRVLVSQEGRIITLPLDEAKNFSVYESGQIGLAKGDIIRITQNGYSRDKKRLDNGNILTIKGFDEKGDIIALTSGNNKIVLDKNHRNLTHAYYSTSPGSQGKSVNRVLILQTTQTGKAASKEQFYVSASRGKFEISIYTDNKQRLLDSVQRASTRMSAMEVAAPLKTKTRMQAIKAKFNQIGETARTKVSEMKEAVQGKIHANFNLAEKQKSAPDRTR